MIGGGDIIIELPGVTPSVALTAVVRHILDRWPAGVVQDGDSGRRFESFSAIDFTHLREVFVYRDEHAFASWERLGADPTNFNQMVHLLASPGQLTVVVDRLSER